MHVKIKKKLKHYRSNGDLPLKQPPNDEKWKLSKTDSDWNRQACAC